FHQREHELRQSRCDVVRVGVDFRRQPVETAKKLVQIAGGLKDLVLQLFRRWRHAAPPSVTTSGRSDTAATDLYTGRSGPYAPRSCRARANENRPSAAGAPGTRP